jgi:hypothetical protein
MIGQCVMYACGSCEDQKVSVRAGEKADVVVL